MCWCLKSKPRVHQVGCTLPIAFFWLASALLGDTILLKSGQTVSGTWIGADNRAVRMAVGDRVQTIAVSDIVRVDFGDAASALSAAAVSASALPVKPDLANKQAKFCESIEAYRTDLMHVVNEPNPIVRAGLHKPEPVEYDSRLLGILGTSGEFDSWRGTLRFHVTGQWVVLEFTPDCKPPQGILFATASTVKTSDARQTLIPLNSPLARTLSQVKVNDSVTASGHLIYVPGKSAYLGSPDNPNPSVAAPRYLAQFSSFTRVP